VARNKVPLPDTAAEWLSGYLERRGIDAARYPNELGTLEWQRLKTAYRQYSLQQTRIAAVNGADQSQPNAIDLIEENNKLVKVNNELTIKANKKHLQFKELESKQTKHNQQLEGLNQKIFELNDKPLALRCKKLEKEVTRLKARVAELLKSNGKVNRKARVEITPAIKAEITKQLLTGKPQQEIADELGVSRGVVGKIKKEYMEK